MSQRLIRPNFTDFITRSTELQFSLLDRTYCYDQAEVVLTGGLSGNYLYDLELLRLQHMDIQ